MRRHRSSESAIVQLVLALEKASVAAVKREISVVMGAECDEVWLVLEGIALGSSVEVIGAGSSLSGGGVAGGVGGRFGSSGDVIGAGSVVFSFAESVTESRFCNPLILGTRKL